MSRAPCTSLTLTIRKARDASEIADAAALYQRAGTAAFTWRRAGYFQVDDFKRFAEEEEVWLALAGNALVGILSFFRADNFIHCLYVDPDAQRLGIGRALVAQLRNDTVGSLTLKLDTPNLSAIAFYEATGWTRMTGPEDFGTDSEGVSWARYRLA
jgi:ribosomal protein S18 acetylase RimI-like enzyme